MLCDGHFSYMAVNHVVFLHKDHMFVVTTSSGRLPQP